MNIRKFPALGAVILAAVLWSGAQKLSAQSMATDFTLKDTLGNTVSLSSFKGKVVFLDFWASWCPPCRKSIPKVQELYEKYKGSNVVVLGINVENNAETAAKFAKKENLTYPVLVGNDKVEQDYHISGIPGFFIIDTQGMIIKKYEGYYPGLENEWEKIISGALNQRKMVTSPKRK